MIVLDANILMYAYDSASSFHERARIWVEQTFSSNEIVGIPPSTVAAFLRITTHPQFPGTRLKISNAVAIVDEWFAQPNVRWLAQTDHGWQHTRRCCLESGAVGNLVPDAMLAALAMEHAAILCTTDNDFSRFAGLQWNNPLLQ